MLIPRVFHQIWLGPDRLPDEYARYQQTWLDHHPDWQLHLWTEDNLPHPLRRPEAAEKLRVPAERANILRLELLWRHGGVYLDTDFECLRSIEPLIDQAELFISLAKPGRVNNALMGSIPNHPLLDHALEQIQPRQYYGHDKAATGVLFLDTLLLGRDDVTFVEPDLVHPRTAEARARAYAIHHMARSWKDDPDQLRRDLRKAERLGREAERSAAKWRARYERSRAELLELQRAVPYRLARLVRGWKRRRPTRRRSAGRPGRLRRPWGRPAC